MAVGTSLIRLDSVSRDKGAHVDPTPPKLSSMTPSTESTLIASARSTRRRRRGYSRKLPSLVAKGRLRVLIGGPAYQGSGKVITGSCSKKN